MKRKNLYMSGLLILAGFTVMTAAQTPSAKHGDKFEVTSVDLAATFTIERAKVQSSACSCFWLKGGSGDLAITFYRGFGIAGNVTGEHASNIAPGVNLDKFSYMAGPRYTFDARRMFRQHDTRIFGEALFGLVHGYNSVFPGPSGTSYSAGAFSTQFGVGSDIALHKGLGVRPFEVDYIHTSLPNNGSNSQNDLRLAFGISYRFASR